MVVEAEGTVRAVVNAGVSGATIGPPKITPGAPSMASASWNAPAGVTAGKSTAVGASLGASASGHASVPAASSPALTAGLSGKASTAAAVGAGALKASAVAKALAVVGAGALAATVAVSVGVAPGLQVALTHVPVWTHAHSVLSQLVGGLSGRGSGGLSLHGQL